MYFNFLAKFYFIFIRSITKWQILPYKVIIFNLDNVLKPQKTSGLKRTHQGLSLSPKVFSNEILFKSYKNGIEGVVDITFLHSNDSKSLRCKYSLFILVFI